ncbi:MAG: hypothetical protein K0R18_237 [Bacillales bacterium]|jgi:Uri superfamily endonuclease|nr:hypothetical protein [Bacillales bacterium]
MIKNCEICEGLGCDCCKCEGLYYDFEEDELLQDKYDYEKDEQWQIQMKKVVENTIKLVEKRNQRE